MVGRRILRNMLLPLRNEKKIRVLQIPRPRSTAPSVLGDTPCCDRSLRIRERAQYRASLPIMVLAFLDNHDAAVPIPAGDVFEVLGPAPDDRFTVVDVKGQEFLVFDSDLKEFALPVVVQKLAAVAAS